MALQLPRRAVLAWPAAWVAQRVVAAEEVPAEVDIPAIVSAAGVSAAGVPVPVVPPAEVPAPDAGASEAPAAVPTPPPGPSAFDFDVPFRGEPRDSKLFLGKATLVVNVKLDDPYTLENLPGLQDLRDKYAKQGLNVLAFPTDQGWFEADDSDTLRLKFKQAFDFGQFPGAVVFDKVDLLGLNALPLYKYLTSALPNPWGLDRIVLNYEKFLLDASGRPLRRYPRKFLPSFIDADIEAVLKGEPLPPPSPALVTAWEAAKREAIKSEYAFKFGLNYYKFGSPAS